MTYLTRIALLFITAGLIAISCAETPAGPGEDNEENPGETEPPTLQAVISSTPANPEVGTEITLDASDSEDEQEIGYQVQWSLESRPTDSETSLESTTEPQATFVPDVPGDYTVMLTISNDTKEISDSQQSTIAVVDTNQTKEISGNINADQTLEDFNEDPSIPDYLVTGNLNVNAVLTIDPGVVIHFQENRMMTISSDGTLIAEGTEADSIKFTTANRAGELYWKGIFVQSSTSQNSLKYVKTSYAGNEEMDFTGDNFRAAVGVNERGKLKVTNSDFMDNSGFGLYVDEKGALEDFNENTFSRNEVGVGLPANEVNDIDSNSSFSNNNASVILFGTTLAEGNEVTWNALADGAAYRVVGNLYIDGVLTIAHGARFESDENVLWHINGALIVDGTETDNISFTSSDSEAGLYWKGLFFRSADSRNKLNYVSLSQGGNEAINFVGDDFAVTVGVGEGAKLAVTNSSVSGSLGYGLYLDEQGQLTSFSANSFSDNLRAVGLPANEADDMDTQTTFSGNTEAEVEIMATNYAQDKESTWQPLAGSASYRMSGNINIQGALSIAAGAKFELDENVLVTVDGSMTAEGTADNTIGFTTSNLGGELYWKGLYFRSSSSLNKLEHVKVSYAGNEAIDFVGTNYKAGVGVGENARLAVLNSELSGNQGYGLYVDERGLLNEFSANVISDNQAGVGVPANEVDDMDFNTLLSNNSDGDVIIFGTTLASSKEVTWQGLSENAAYRVMGNLDIDGVLTLGSGARFLNDENVQWRVQGALRSTGEPGQEVVLTTSNQAGGIHWKGLFIRSSDSRNSLNYTTVSYAGNEAHDFTGDNFKANVGVNTNARMDITNSIISNSAGYGVYSKGTINDIESSGSNNTFNNNGTGNSY